MSDITYIEIMTAELKVDCYCGENADEHTKYWNGYCAGDKQDDDFKEPIILDVALLPPGTKVIVKEPACPKCGEVYGNCMVRGYGNENECDFDWKNWAEEQYS